MKPFAIKSSFKKRSFDLLKKKSKTVSINKVSKFAKEISEEENKDKKEDSFERI